MGLNLIMKRQIFAIIQNLAVEYEEKYGKRRGLTPLITNQLLAEALITRGLLPDNFLEDEYGAPDPLLEGFAYRGFRNKAVRERRAKKPVQDRKNIEEWAKRFVDVAEQWETITEKSKQYHLAKARELENKIPEAKLILQLQLQQKQEGVK